MINLMMTKYRIYKCKFTNKKPCFIAFTNEIKQYILSINTQLIIKQLKLTAFTARMVKTFPH